MSLCQIMMVQTASRRLEKLRTPDLIITDENHHSKATGYRKIYDYFKNAYRVGVTATPVRLDGSGLIDVNDDLIIGVSAKWLIANQFLAPYDYYAPDIADLSGLKTKMGEFVTKDSETALNKPKIYGDIIKYYRKYADGVKAICYCVSVAHSLKMAEEFQNAGIPAEHLDGETPKEKRSQIIEDFRKGEIQILCNVDLISEGFDVLDCGCVIMLRPTQSLTLYIQQAMRCMRYQPQKRAIILDHVGNYSRHGMPDDDREWTLEGNPKKHGQKLLAEKDLQTVQCENCYGVFVPETSPAVCPYCGYVFKVKSREIQTDETAEIKKIEGFHFNVRLQLSVKLRIRDDVPQKCQNRLLFLNIFKKKTPNELDMQVEGYNYSHLYHLLDVSGLLARGMQFESMSDICHALVGCELRVTVRHETYKGALQVKIDPENGVQPSRVTYGAPPDVETNAGIDSSITDFDDGDVPF